jgi:phosphate transport system substrate-binding protein
LLAAAIACAGTHAAGVDPALPRYEPTRFEVPASERYVGADGSIVVVGYNDMADILRPLAARFAASHAGVRLALDLRGTRFAPDALAAGTSAFAPMGAVFTPPQLAAYRARRGDEPVAIRVAHAAIDPRALSGPLAIFVHRDNPVSMLTLEDVARIFSGEAARWGDVGVAGPWAARKIAPVGLQSGTALAYEFRDRVLGGRELAARMIGVPQSAGVVMRVAMDPGAIGFAAATQATPNVRALAISARTGEPAVAPTEVDIGAGRYPLDRHLYIYVSRPIAPVTREFLRLMLSREGQESVAASPQGYLPLSAREAAFELAKIDAP